MVSSEIVEVEDMETWEQLVEKSKKPVLVMFYNLSCPHCLVMEPYFVQYAKEFNGKVVFVKVNVTDSPSIAAKYGVMGTPTFKFFCDGHPIQEQVGEFYPALIKKIVDDGLTFGAECAKKASWFSVDITGYA